MSTANVFSKFEPSRTQETGAPPRGIHLVPPGTSGSSYSGSSSMDRRLNNLGRMPDRRAVAGRRQGGGRGRRITGMWSLAGAAVAAPTAWGLHALLHCLHLL